MSSLLNYKLEGEGRPVVLIHGLFGSLDNLGLLARDLRLDHQVLSIDLRNHGHSFHSDEHHYQALAQDVANLLKHLNIYDAVIIGHSMGGKVTMKLTEIAPEHLAKIVVLDMSPVAYHVRRHEHIFAGLQQVIDTPPATRAQALTLLAQHINEEGVRQFIAKSLYKTEENKLAWRFNVPALRQNYEQVLGWEAIPQTNIPTLLIKGGDSDYLLPEHQTQIQAQFTQVKAHVIANTGHWLHAEKPKEVLRAIRKFL